MKATDVIKQDHRAAEALFDEFNAAPEEAKRDIEKKIFKALTAHELMEDRYFYPALVEKSEHDEALQEIIAEQVKLEASTMGTRALEATTGKHDDRMQNVMENVLSHARKEEANILPRAEQWLTEDELNDLGAKMAPESAVAKSEEDRL